MPNLLYGLCLSDTQPRLAQSWARRCVTLFVAVVCMSGAAACTIDNGSTGSTEAVESAASRRPEDVGTPDSRTDKSLYRDMNNQEVDMDNADYAGHTPEEIQQVSNYGPEGPRMRIPSVGLDVPLGTMNSYNGVIEPVGFSQAYIVGDFSPGFHDPAAGSLMLVAHALDGKGKAPGNYVWDSASGEPKVAVGSEISAQGRTYIIDEVAQVRKAEIVDDEDLWEQRPGTLFFVTCVPNSDENLVVSAHLVTQ